MGCFAFVLTAEVGDSITKKESEAILKKLRSGMSPAEVEEMIGRPPEYTVRYAGDGYSHNWDVRGWRLEVIYEGDLSEKWHTFRPDPSPVQRAFGWFFFWWLSPFVED
jgi:hypothetical protein